MEINQIPEESPTKSREDTDHMGMNVDTVSAIQNHTERSVDNQSLEQMNQSARNVSTLLKNDKTYMPLKQKEFSNSLLMSNRDKQVANKGVANLNQTQSLFGVKSLSIT